MKSNICILNGKPDELIQISKEIEKVADYNSLGRKQLIQLLLLAEELIGIQKGILGFTKGDFYIENIGREYRLCLHADIYTDVITQERFVEMSTKNENIATKGIRGKIKYVVNYLMNANSDVLPDYDLFVSQSNYCNCDGIGNYDKIWSLSDYKGGVSEKTEIWDEMERSIVVNIADDLIVGAMSNYIDLIVVKKI